MKAAKIGDSKHPQQSNNSATLYDAMCVCRKILTNKLS